MPPSKHSVPLQCQRVSPSCHLNGSAYRQPPCWQTLSSMVSQRAWLGKYVNSNLVEQWLTQTSLCGGGWPVWHSWWQSYAVLCVFTQVALHCVCILQSVAVHDWESSHPELRWASLSIFTLIPLWQISDLMMGHFLLKEGKTWEARRIWLTVIFSVAFLPCRYSGWWRFAP